MYLHRNIALSIMCLASLVGTSTVLSQTHKVTTQQVVCDSYEMCLKQALSGNVEAQYQVAVLLGEGIGVNENEEATSIEWLQKAAGNGHIEATKELAFIYRDGTGTKKDAIKAFKLFKKAKDAGDLEAQVHLALCFLQGHGTKKDTNIAVDLLQEAAEKGDDLAQAQLGICYAKGIGVTYNLVQSFAWLNVADENSGDGSYSKLKHEIYDKMERTDRFEATKLSSVYLARYASQQIA